MIAEEIYRDYLAALLAGEHRLCHTIVQGLLARGVEIKDLYLGVFQRSLYEVGEMWEHRKISVAIEHMATAITESLFSLVYPRIFSAEHGDKSVVIACVPNERHQIGAKMIADFFELHGWNGYFLGADTPESDLLQLVDEKRPQIVGLSLSLYVHLPDLMKIIDAIMVRRPESQILVGGQAFRHGGADVFAQCAKVRYVPSADDLYSMLAEC